MELELVDDDHPWSLDKANHEREHPYEKRSDPECDSWVVEARRNGTKCGYARQENRQSLRAECFGSTQHGYTARLVWNDTAHVVRPTVHGR